MVKKGEMVLSTTAQIAIFAVVAILAIAIAGFIVYWRIDMEPRRQAYEAAQINPSRSAVADREFV